MATQQYVLRNISAYDINLSDLGIRIPRGKSKNLLDPIYRLRYEDISTSRTSGSILVRLNKNYLIEDAPLDNDFHSYTEVLAGESSDEIPIYVALTEEYKKITKENLFAGSGVVTHVADATHDGYLKSTDWVTFSSGGHSPVTLNASAATGGLSLSGQALAFRAATTAVDGYLKHADWNTFYGKLTDPMTTRGSILYKNASNVTAGLTIGLDGYVLTSNGTDVSWGVNHGNDTTRTFDLVTFTSEYDNGNSGANHTINWNNGQQQKITLNNSCTFAFTAPIGAKPSRFTLKVVQGGTGSYTITWPGTAFATGGAAPTLTGTVASVDILAVYFDGTYYHVGMAVSDSKVIS